jgi:hypothetical protein
MDRKTFPLRILPINSLKLFSAVPQEAVRKLAAEIESTGFLRNPIAVSLLESGEYGVLDGETRTKALEQLCVRDILAQIVDPSDPLASIGCWRHLVDQDSMRLLREAASRARLVIRKGNEPSVSNIDRCLGVTFRDGERFEIVLGSDGVLETNKRLRDLILSYSTEKQPARIGSREVDELDGTEHDEIRGSATAKDVDASTADESVLINFPHYGYPELKYLSSLNEELPPYLLEVSFPRRYLGVNLTLKILADNVSIAVKNEFLDQLLRMRLCSCRAAYYSQSVILMNG